MYLKRKQIDVDSSAHSLADWLIWCQITNVSELVRFARLTLECLSATELVGFYFRPGYAHETKIILLRRKNVISCV